MLESDVFKQRMTGRKTILPYIFGLIRAGKSNGIVAVCYVVVCSSNMQDHEETYLALLSIISFRRFLFLFTLSYFLCHCFSSVLKHSTSATKGGFGIRAALREQEVSQIRHKRIIVIQPGKQPCGFYHGVIKGNVLCSFRSSIFATLL